MKFGFQIFINMILKFENNWYISTFTVGMPLNDNQYNNTSLQLFCDCDIRGCFVLKPKMIVKYS